MSSDILKTLTISLTSSMCTALFVVACAAGATDGDKGGGGGDDSGGGIDAATLAALELRVLELESEVAGLQVFKSNSLCFIGHMTDDMSWWGVQTDRTSQWEEMVWDTLHVGETEWGQGPNSDAMVAYAECFSAE